jgi:hypothetical protein
MKDRKRQQQYNLPETKQETKLEVVQEQLHILVFFTKPFGKN